MTFPHLPLSRLVLPSLLAALAAAGPAPAGEHAPAPPAPAASTAVKLPGLERCSRLSPRLLVGSKPEGDAGFRSLRRLGVRTILSVDGAPPDVALARRFGLRYVHLPFGYDGCPTPRAREIVRAVRDLPAPLYLHCHHGKHRAPAAAALARRALDGLSAERAEAEMRRAGTDPRYAGLFRSVREFRPPSTAELDALPARFPETVAPPPLVATMVDLEARTVRLAALAGEAPPGAGRAAARETLLVRELLAELAREGIPAARRPEFRAWLARAVEAARGLERAAGSGAPTAAALERLRATCDGCHAAVRQRRPLP